MNDIFYRVYSYNLMRYLESLGFKVLRTKQLDENPRKTMWVYEKTDSLLTAIMFYEKMKTEK